MTPLFSRAVRTLGAVLLLGILAAPAHAADAPFSSRFAQTLRGNISAVGNTLMVSEVVKRVPPIALRYYLAASHYRSIVEFSEEALAEAATAF